MLHQPAGIACQSVYGEQYGGYHSDVAHEIAVSNGVDRRRSASLLDIFSCVVQGLIPYGAQLLLAGSIAKLSPLSIAGNNWYCMLLAVAAVFAILFGIPRVRPVRPLA